MNDGIDMICRNLYDAGVRADQRICICCENCAEYTWLVAACWSLGAVAVPLSTRYSKSQARQAAKDTGCDMIFVSQAFEKINAGVPEIIIEDIFTELHNLKAALRFSDFNFNLEARASIILTSGTSAKPKGVLHTVGNHYYSALGSNKNIPFTKGDCWAMSLPMYHISGFSLIMRAMLEGGSIYYPQINEKITETVMLDGLTHISLVATQIMQLLKSKNCIERLKKYKAILIGGSAIPNWVIKNALAENLPVYATYGSTETASQLFTTDRSGLLKDIKTSGRLLKYRDAKIADDGEILARGKTIFKGYVTSDGIDPAIDEKGWFHTGDIGRLDKEGRLYVTGRKDRMFISGGENIHPREIEAAIETVDNVQQAFVLAIDDDKFGKRPAAFIKMKNGGALDPAYIKQTLSKSLEGFKIPKTYYPWPENTRNEVMKLDFKIF